MTAATIQKYKKYTVAQLKKKAQVVFNKFIRERDKDLPCISCKKAPVQQAGHFYSAGHYNHLRFNELNTNGQCVRCNHFLSGNLNVYRINLEAKIGTENLKQLDILANHKSLHKDDRFTLIDIIEKYKQIHR